jgi:hypothetical protein
MGKRHFFTKQVTLYKWFTRILHSDNSVEYISLRDEYPYEYRDRPDLMLIEYAIGE